MKINRTHRACVFCCEISRRSLCVTSLRHLYINKPHLRYRHFQFARFLFAMAINHDKTWVGYLTAHIVDRCIEHCMADCPGCIDGIYSPLLHWHNRLHLLSKVEKYFCAVVNQMDLSTIFDQFVVRFGFFSLSREQFIKEGETFLRQQNSRSIFFGDYITPSLDDGLYADFSHTATNDSTPEPPGLNDYIPASPEPTTVKGVKRKKTTQDREQPKKRKRIIKTTAPTDSLISQNGILGDGSASTES